LSGVVEMAHGGGGRAMRRLIEDILLPAFDNPLLAPLDDQAMLPLAELAAGGDRLAFTTDSYVVTPLVFRGGDIGSLAVTGTVNDLAVGGARPLYLSCALVLEEGLPLATLRAVVASMRRAADQAGVAIVTGDTKVVERGAADQMFINTAGVGVVPRAVELGTRRIAPGDAVLVNGALGDHGIAILVARAQLALQAEVASDCQPLHGLVAAMLAAGGSQVRCLRDATRGAGMRIEEAALPLQDAVRGACEILGLDPLYLANEGKLVAVVASEAAERVLAAMRAHPAGRGAARIGTVTEGPRGTVVLHTGFGGQRVVDLLTGDQLPRIC
jgi:hydrogenase expression/formation protein HypE